MRNKRIEEENNYFCAQKTTTDAKDQNKRKKSSNSDFILVWKMLNFLLQTKRFQYVHYRAINWNRYTNDFATLFHSSQYPTQNRSDLYLNTHLSRFRLQIRVNVS